MFHTYEARKLKVDVLKSREHILKNVRKIFKPKINTNEEEKAS